MDFREWFEYGKKLEPIMIDLGNGYAQLNGVKCHYVEFNEEDISFEDNEIGVRLYTKSGCGCCGDDYESVYFCYADLEHIFNQLELNDGKET